MARNLRGAPAGARVGPVGPTWRPLAPWLLPVSSGSFPRPDCDVAVADKFCVYFALESLFSSFLKFTLENTEYAKLVQNSD